jgi:thioredoxin reductase
MDKVTVLGAGTYGLALIEEIRAKNIPCSIELIDKNACFLPKQRLISSPGDVSGRVELERWAKEREVKFTCALAERINPRRRKIYFKGGDTEDFDNLIITSGLSSKKLPVKGEYREGFFYLSEIDPFKLKDLLRISQEACVYVSTSLGLQLAAALAGLGKEVRVVAASLDFLGADKEETLKGLSEKNISLYLDSFIEEAVGEGSVKAAKLSPLMVFSCQLVFIDSGFVPNLKFFEEELPARDGFFTPLEASGSKEKRTKLLTGCTDFEGVYLLGDVNHKLSSRRVIFTYDAEGVKDETRVFAEFIASGTKPVFNKPVMIDGKMGVNIENHG